MPRPRWPQSIARRGETPIVVLLTDGRGNIARDGSPGRARAGDDVQLAARQFRAAGLRALLIDTSPQPQAAARQLAQEMGASYLPLPYAGVGGVVAGGIAGDEIGVGVTGDRCGSRGGRCPPV